MFVFRERFRQMIRIRAPFRDVWKNDLLLALTEHKMAVLQHQISKFSGGARPSGEEVACGHLISFRTQVYSLCTQVQPTKEKVQPTKEKPTKFNRPSSTDQVQPTKEKPCRGSTIIQRFCKQQAFKRRTSS